MASPSVVFGGPSLEHDVSILTGLQAARVLAKSGAEPVVLYWSADNRWFRVPADLEASAFLDGVPVSARPVSLDLGSEPGFYETRSLGRRTRIEVSAVLLCCHGGPGEDGRLQAAFDLAGIAYTGPNSACASLTMDKLAFSGVAAAAGLPVLPRVAWSAASPPPPFEGPYIVKPRFGGSSIGIEIVDDVDTVRDMLKSSPYFRRGTVIEPFRPGLEDLYIAIRTHPKLQLSLIERPARAGGEAKIYGYQQKYLQQSGAESQVSEIPAQLPEDVAKRMRAGAEEIAELTRLTGNARLDFLWDGSDLFINAKRAAMADQDPPDRHAADRKAQTLRSAGTIAQKLI